MNEAPWACLGTLLGIERGNSVSQSACVFKALPGLALYERYGNISPHLVLAPGTHAHTPHASHSLLYRVGDLL